MNRLSPEEKKASRRWAAVIVVLLLAAVPLIRWISGLEIFQRVPAPPECSQELLAAADGTDTICAELSLDPVSASLSGTETLTLRNRTGQTLDEAVLRVWPGAYETEQNAPIAEDESPFGEGKFLAGGIIVTEAQINGSAVPVRYTDDALTVIRLNVPGGWAANESLSVTLRFSGYVPTSASRFGKTDGIYTLTDICPVPALWQDGDWRLDAYTPVGTPMVNECLSFTVDLTLPEGYTAAATAYSEPVRKDQSVRYHWQAPAARGFSITVVRNGILRGRIESGVLVTALAEDAATAEALLDTAAKAVKIYSRLWGNLPCPSLNISVSSVSGSSLARSGLILIDTDSLRTGGQTLQLAAAAQIAREWWGQTVGTDGFYEAWIAESLGQYAMLEFIGDVYGASSREDAAYRRIELSLRANITSDLTPGSPLDYFTSAGDYVTVVKCRGAALWRALETRWSREQVNRILQRAFLEYRFSFLTRQDLLDLIQQETGEDLTELLTDYLDTRIG